MIRNHTARNFILAAASLVFYAFGEPVAVMIMLLSIILNYFFGLGASGSKWDKAAVALAAVLNIGLLIAYKYTGFFVEIFNGITGLSIPVPQIRLPIGISFFTFQGLSYVIDVYRDKKNVQKNLFSVLLYISFFPQLIAGPIVRYQDIADRLNEREFSFDRISRGLCRFIFGLSKKVLIANQMGILADRMLLNESGTISAWVGIAAYTLQIYYDFSGYSDMAIGLGRMLGFRFMENFAHPYVSRSVTEFWRRWHISLSSWFKEYVYIPLGGNRKGVPRQCLNLLFVWMLTGLWHGASVNFILWGLYYAVLLILEKLILGRLIIRLPVFIRHILTLFIVAFGWGIFYYTDIGLWRAFVDRLFVYHIDTTDTIHFALAYLPVFLIACPAATMLPRKILKSIRRRGMNFIEIMLLIILFILCTAALVSQSYNPFIYFRF